MSVFPAAEGKRLYEKIYGKRGYDENWGASLVSIMGGQGSAKTACCLDIAEKKLKHHPNNEKIFWYDTIGSPCQYRKVKWAKYKIFVEDGHQLKFIESTTGDTVNPNIVTFSDIEELYHLAEYKTINVVYFKSKKSWMGFNDEPSRMGLMDYCMSYKQREWQTIIFDEMESIFPAEINNASSDKWWDWTTKVVAPSIMEGRKCRVGVIGNFHNKGSVYHSIRNKFMFHMWGFGSLPFNTRVNQGFVDHLKMGEFAIDHQGNTFGKIKVKTMYTPPDVEWIVRLI
jgi:hypothetical protein